MARGYDVPPSLGRVQVDTDDREQKQRSGVIPHPGPAHPQYASYEARLRSYREWPPGLSQDPATMAEAGLYYYGISDQVTISAPQFLERDMCDPITSLHLLSSLVHSDIASINSKQ